MTAANIAMLRACSSATSMSTERCCNTWNWPDRPAELLPRLQIFQCQFVHRLHRADRLGAQCRDRLVHHMLDRRQRRTCFAQRIVLQHAHAGQRDLGRAQPILRRITAPAHAGGSRIHHEQSDAAAIAPIAGDARRHQQPIRTVAVQHDALGAIQHPFRAVLPRGGGDIGKVIARLSLDMREGQFQLALRHLRHQCLLLLRRCRRAATGRRRGSPWQNTAPAPGRGRMPPSRSSSRPRRRRSRHALPANGKPSRPSSAYCCQTARLQPSGSAMYFLRCSNWY